MNTYMTFTAYGENAQDALEEATGLIQSLESLWSVTDEDSEIYEANHSRGNLVQVSDKTAAVLSFILDMAEETRGSLEPTIYPVLTAWGFTTLVLAATEMFGELLDMEYSGEENLQKQSAAVYEKEEYLWHDSNADNESGTSDLECKRCGETMTLKW